jgi:hypothetical protein
MQDFEANDARSRGPESGEDVNQPLVQPDEEGQRQSKHQQKDNSHNKQKVPTVTYGAPRVQAATGITRESNPASMSPNLRTRPMMPSMPKPE